MTKHERRPTTKVFHSAMLLPSSPAASVVLVVEAERRREGVGFSPSPHSGKVVGVFPVGLGKEEG